MKLIRSDNSIFDLSLNGDMKNHYENKTSYADFIVNEINSGYYDNLFKGKKDLRVIDGGTNVGLFSLFCSPSCSKIVGIEPTPKFQKILDQIKPDINCEFKLFKGALWNKDRQERFNFTSSNSTMNSIMHGNAGYILVDTFSVKTILKEFDYVDLFKIDIEGAEEVVINSLDQEDSDKIKAFFLEYHVGCGVNKDNIVNKLINLGYNCSESDYSSGYTIYASK